MLYKTLSAAVYGIDASIIEVEVDVSGIKSMKIIFILWDFPMRRCARAATVCAPR